MPIERLAIERRQRRGRGVLKSAIATTSICLPCSEHCGTSAGLESRYVNSRMSRCSVANGDFAGCPPSNAGMSRNTPPPHDRLPGGNPFYRGTGGDLELRREEWNLTVAAAHRRHQSRNANRHRQLRQQILREHGGRAPPPHPLGRLQAIRVGSVSLPPPIPSPPYFLTNNTSPNRSQIEPGWHAWISYAVDKPPTQDKILQTMQRPWELREHRMNPTQSRGAYKPYNTVIPKVSAWEPKVVAR